MSPDGRLAAPRTHLAAIAVVAAFIVLLYAQVSGAWFCGYDDFNELHRAVFVDSRNPSTILTTTHFVGFMYRPVTSALQYATWSAFHSAAAFRVRNLIMHLISAAMLYGIVWLLLRSVSIAFGSALLFGIEPLSNETVVVAIWTNATAYALVFTALFFFLWALERAGRNAPWRLQLAVAALCMLLALFTYEPTFAAFGVIAVFAIAWRARGLPVPRGFAIAACAVFCSEALFFFAVRHLVLTSGAALNAPDVILRNAAMYAAALLVPIDPVLSHALFGTPFPAETHAGGKVLLLGGCIATMVLATAVIALRRFHLGERFQRADRAAAVVFGLAIPLGVLPLLLYRTHPSESNLYLSTAFYAALLCVALRRLCRTRVAYGVAVSLFALSFASGVAVRNEKVAACAAIAKSIVTELPEARWHQGKWSIRLAAPLGEPWSPPYALYNHTGLSTLEVSGTGTPGAQEALQLAAHNDEITAHIVPAASLLQHCVRPYSCFWVSGSGHVVPAVLAGLKY